MRGEKGLQGSSVSPVKGKEKLKARLDRATCKKLSETERGSAGGNGNRAVRSPGRKRANVFAGREVGEGGKAEGRKRKRDSEPWGSRMEHTVCQRVAEVWSVGRPGGL